MKVYKMFIKPMIGYSGQNGEPKRASIEQEEKWYPEEERERLIEKYNHLETSFFEHLTFEKKYEELEIPEIIRCKDCKYYDDDEYCTNGVFADWQLNPNWFCADGERRTDDAEHGEDH